MDTKLTGGEQYVQDTKESDSDQQPEKRHSITGDVFVNDHGADTELRRILSTRHLTMIALGSSIGMGLVSIPQGPCQYAKTFCHDNLWFKSRLDGAECSGVLLRAPNCLLILAPPF